MSVGWLNNPIKVLDRVALDNARKRQQKLTKPPGSLGRLEDLAIQLGGMQGCDSPRAEQIAITVFAADHGVAASGVSAFPQEVTVQMLANFSAGGAAISVLARQLDATLEVVDVGTAIEPNELAGVISHRAGSGTANLHHQDAMTGDQLAIALAAGQAAVQRAVDAKADIFIGGDMGIANTTSAAAIASVLLQAEPRLLAGPGTGLDEKGVLHKANVLSEALSRYQGLEKKPLETLRCLGGFEIAALVGAYLRCAQLGVPALVDGYITTAAALVAIKYQPDVGDWLIFSHQSAEPGHKAMLDFLQVDPLLDLGMRLGEGSGAAMAVSLLRLACGLHNGMATFADAGISES